MIEWKCAVILIERYSGIAEKEVAMSGKLLKIRRGGVRGLSLLEILIAIMVLTAALMSFASVFPAAFKVSRYAGNYSRAEKYASGVVEELRNLKFKGNAINATDGDSGIGGDNVAMGFIEAYTSGGKDVRANINKLKSVKAFTDGGKFKLGSNNIIHINGTFCTFTVTVCWKETGKAGRVVDRSVTVVGGRTGRRI